MLHKEELALRRALQASLVQERTIPEKSTVRCKTRQEVAPTTASPPLAIPDVSPSDGKNDSSAVKKIKHESQPEQYGILSPSPPSSSGSRSVSSTHEKPFESPMLSPIGSPGSIDSSLRLVLSTSSLSSSSTSSNWSSAPSSPFSSSIMSSSKGGPKGRKGKQKYFSLKSKQSFSGSGKRRGKIAVDKSFFHETSPSKVKTPLNKTVRFPSKAKSPKTTKASAKLAKQNCRCTELKTTGPKRNPPKEGSTDLFATQDNALSPEAVLVFHDHCYFTQGSVNEQSKHVVREVTRRSANLQSGSSGKHKSSGSSGWLVPAYGHNNYQYS